LAPTKAFNRNDGVNRKWVSYTVKHKALFCCICICYGDGTGPFSKGFTHCKHVYTRISEHENSKKHKMNVDAHIIKKNYGFIDSPVTYSHSSIMKKEVENRRQVLLRIIDIIKLIGKRGLSYRAKNNEAAYTLINPSLDHGNFLEMILLLGKYDPILKAHLEKSIKNSIKSHNAGSK